MNLKVDHLRYQSILGFNCNGLFSSIDWTSPSFIKRAAEVINEIQPKMLRVFDGGGFRYVHPMFDENGSRSVGYGYREEEIEVAFQSGELDEDQYNSYVGKLEKQKLVTVPYIDMLIYLNSLLVYKPVVIYMVNVINETPENEVAAINYLISSGVNVVGVELGNEMYGKTLFEAYEFMCLPFISAIRAYSSSMQISMPMGPAGYTNRHKRWNKALSAAIKNGLDIDAVVPHIYYNVEKEGDASEYTQGYLSTNPNFEITKDSAPRGAFLSHMRNIMSKAVSLFNKELDEAERVSLGLPLWVTEFGTAPSSPFSNSFPDTVAIALMYDALLNRASVVYAGYQSLLSGDFHAAITPVKRLDPDSTKRYLATRAKWFMLMHLAQASYFAMGKPVWLGNEVISIPFYMKHDEEHELELVVLNCSDSPYNLDLSSVELGEKLYAPFLRWANMSIFGAPHFGNGHSDVYGDNSYYNRGKRVENNVQIKSIDVASPKDIVELHGFSIGAIAFSIVEPGEKPESSSPKSIVERLAKAVKLIFSSFSKD